MSEPFDQLATDTALAEWIRASTSLKAVWLYENITQPAHPFVGLYVMNVNPVSTLPEVLTESVGATEITRVYRTQDVLCLQVNVFSKDRKPSSTTGKGTSIQLLKGALADLAKSDRTQALRTAGLAYQRHGTVRRMPQKEADLWIDRAMVEVYFGLETRTTEVIPFVDAVRLEGDLEVVTVGPFDVELP